MVCGWAFEWERGDASLWGPWDACGPLCRRLERAAGGASYEEARAAAEFCGWRRASVDSRRELRSEKRSRNDALSATDKKSGRFVRRGVRARAELKNTCSEQTDISPAAKRRGPRRRRRAV